MARLSFRVKKPPKTEKKRTSGRQTQDRVGEAPAVVLGHTVRRHKRRKLVLGHSSHEELKKVHVRRYLLNVTAVLVFTSFYTFKSISQS